MNRYVALDVETTGLSLKNGDRVIEIGAVAVKKLCHFNNEGYMYQPQYHEREVDE